MGNTLNRTPTSPFNKSLLTQLRQRTLSDLLDCYNILTEDYPDCHNLDFSQFADVFGPMFDDPEPFFYELQNDHDLNGTVDVYETLAVFAVFIKETFEKKVSFIFQLFDFDHNDSLEDCELALTLQSAARGLCKFVHIVPPSPKTLEYETKRIFMVIDLNNDSRITIDEFMIWIKKNDELQEFILRYGGIQTIENMKKRSESIYAMFLHHYIQACGAPLAEFAEEKKLREHIMEDKRLNLGDDDVEFLFEILHSTSASFVEGRGKEDKSLISRRAFEHVLKAWCAYSASDINGTNSLSTNELHALLLIYEGEEPSEERVRNEMRTLDKDESGDIDRREWMRYLCLIDKNGKAVFRTSLKIMFERYDTDNSGFLSYDELRDMINQAFRQILNRKNGEERKKAQEMVDSLAREIFEELDIDKSTNVDWEEFKRYMEVSIDRIEKLKDFILHNM